MGKTGHRFSIPVLEEISRLKEQQLEMRREFARKASSEIDKLETIDSSDFEKKSRTLRSYYKLHEMIDKADDEIEQQLATLGFQYH